MTEPSPDAPLLQVSGLEVAFATDRGPARVLDRVNLSIGRGEVVGLVGESGCGKSTLARAILGVLPKPAARVLGGEIRFRGENLLTLGEAALDRRVRGKAIALIPQDPFGSFNPLFSVGSQIMELMKWHSPRRTADRPAPAWLPDLLRRHPRHRRAADRAAAIELLKQVRLPQAEDALDRLPHEFSGGQRQRLMIAMALLPEPDLIIADEPTTALDVTIQAQILRLLRDLVKQRGVSVLFTTHDLGTAYELCDRVVVMYAGQEVEAAPTGAFFARPRHPYTRLLLESLPNPDGIIREIGGEVPNLVAPPPGCRFHPRCPSASARCQERPATIEAEPAHSLRCHHPAQAA